jgi:hypothetical protein
MVMGYHEQTRKTDTSSTAIITPINQAINETDETTYPDFAFDTLMAALKHRLCAL